MTTTTRKKRGHRELHITLGGDYRTHNKHVRVNFVEFTCGIKRIAHSRPLSADDNVNITAAAVAWNKFGKLPHCYGDQKRPNAGTGLSEGHECNSGLAATAICVLDCE